MGPNLHGKHDKPLFVKQNELNLFIYLESIRYFNDLATKAFDSVEEIVIKLLIDFISLLLEMMKFFSIIIYYRGNQI